MRFPLPRSLYLSLVLVLIGLFLGQGLHLKPCCDAHDHAEEASAPEPQGDEATAGWDCFCHVAFVPQPYLVRHVAYVPVRAPLPAIPPDVLLAGWAQVPDRPPRG